MGSERRRSGRVSTVGATVSLANLNDDQMMAAANSLASEIGVLCERQPAGIVMMALAIMVAHGVQETRSEDVTVERALDLHRKTLNFLLQRCEWK